MSVLLRGVKRLNVSWFIGTKDPWENGRGGASYVHVSVDGDTRIVDETRGFVDKESLKNPF